jgi:hypothetical protein
MKALALVVLGFFGGLAAAAIADLAKLGAILLGFLGSTVAVAAGDLISQEVRARLDRLPHAVLYLAIRRLPVELRADVGKEWQAELDQILHRENLYPVTRLIMGLYFAVDLLRTPASMADSLARARNHELEPDTRSWTWRSIWRRYDDLITVATYFVAFVAVGGALGWLAKSIGMPTLPIVLGLVFLMLTSMSLAAFGGFQYVVSAGKPSTISAAKTKVATAFTGLAILIGAAFGYAF